MIDLIVHQIDRFDCLHFGWDAHHVQDLTLRIDYDLGGRLAALAPIDDRLLQAGLGWKVRPGNAPVGRQCVYGLGRATVLDDGRLFWRPG